MTRHADPFTDAVMACADLVARTGARNFEFGYLEDDVPVERARWWAKAQFAGARQYVEDHPSPASAADELAARLLDGGSCPACGRTTYARPTELGRMADYDAGRQGVCWWHRDGPRWVRECDGADHARRKSRAERRGNRQRRKR